MSVVELGDPFYNTLIGSSLSVFRDPQLCNNKCRLPFVFRFQVCCCSFWDSFSVQAVELQRIGQIFYSSLAMTMLRMRLGRMTAG